tara:strand:+ start:5136 stop:5693 length:558 start_codon:yes stop_codon:yes gene_type:complete
MGKIQLKYGTGSASPTELANGEFAINIDSSKLWYGNDGTPVSSLQVESQVIAIEGLDTLGDHNGEVIKLGAQVVSTGKVYGLVDGNWVLATALSESSATAPLAIATAGKTELGMLLQGSVHQERTLTGSALVGSKIYLHNDPATPGSIHHLPPTGSGNVIRALGFVASGSNVIYFKPDTTWIQLS